MCKPITFEWSRVRLTFGAWFPCTNSSVVERSIAEDEHFFYVFPVLIRVCRLITFEWSRVRLTFGAWFSCTNSSVVERSIAEINHFFWFFSHIYQLFHCNMRYRIISVAVFPTSIIPLQPHIHTPHRWFHAVSSLAVTVCPMYEHTSFIHVIALLLIV